jgi:hypothetical protein
MIKPQSGKYSGQNLKSLVLGTTTNTYDLLNTYTTSSSVLKKNTTDRSTKLLKAEKSV